MKCAGVLTTLHPVLAPDGRQYKYFYAPHWKWVPKESTVMGRAVVQGCRSDDEAIIQIPIGEFVGIVRCGLATSLLLKCYIIKDVDMVLQIDEASPRLRDLDLAT